MSAMPSEPPEALSVTSACAQYRISRSQLLQLLAAGTIPAYKIKGAKVREWRVAPEALDAAGVPRREPQVIDLTDTDTDAERLRQAETLVQRLTGELAAERARADSLDSRLGHALLTNGALRQQLLDAGITPSVFGDELGVRRR